MKSSFAVVALLASGLIGSGFAGPVGQADVKEAQFAVVVRDGKEVVTVQVGGLCLEAGELVVTTSRIKTSVVRAVDGQLEMRSGTTVATAKRMSVSLDE